MDISKRYKDLKLILFDLDGTLLADDSSIGAETKKLIPRLQQKGVNFTFATGRLHSAITCYAEELKLNSPLISLDGCLIKKYPSNELLYEAYIKEKHVKKALQYAEKYLINIALCHDEAIYYTENNSVIPQILDKFGARYQEVPTYNGYLDKTLEVVFAGDNKDVIKYVRSRMEFPYSAGLNTSYFKSQSFGGIYYLEIRRKGSSKRTGLFRLLKYFKIRIEQTAVVGDWYNDVSLFETGALKIALSNAVAEIKRMADVVVDKSNNEDGAAVFLENVLRAKAG
jgi:Cof subfamily protein (haloacid dehalogenase superfamily)